MKTAIQPHEIIHDLYESPRKSSSINLYSSPTSSRNILGMMTSMHIRQFVSPFCKYGDLTIQTGYKLPKDVVDKIIIVPKGIEVEASPMVMETETTDIQEQSQPKDPASKRKKNRRRASDNTRTNKTKSGLISSVKLEKKTKMQDILTRICTPTESSLRRSWANVNI